MEDLKGRVALITGGGAGLGAALADSLAQAGAIVAVADLRQEKADAVAHKICSAGGEALALALDVGNADEVDRTVTRVVEQYRSLDVLINNAGTDLTVSIEEMPIPQWDRIVRTNLSGPFMLAKRAIPEMKRQGRGHIVNIVSTAAKRAWANASAYHASKWGLLGLSYAMHVEARPQNIKVTAVICGGMRTGFLLDRFPDIDVTTLQDPRNVADCIRAVLLTPDETVVPELMVLPMRETSWP